MAVHSCLQRGGMDLSFHFSLILEGSNFSPLCAHHLVLPTTVPIPLVGAVEALCELTAPRVSWQRERAKIARGHRRLKAFPLATLLDAFCEKIKHHEKIKACHLPLQIVQD